MPVSNTGPQIQQEKKTVKQMIALYCYHHHKNTSNLCSSCQSLQNYALQRLTFCRFGEEKTTCEKCVRHCYRSDYKQQIKQVMRYAGPRMLFFHPISAIRHLYKNLIK